MVGARGGPVVQNVAVVRLAVGRVEVRVEEGQIEVDAVGERQIGHVVQAISVGAVRAQTVVLRRGGEIHPFERLQKKTIKNSYTVITFLLKKKKEKRQETKLCNG